MKLARLMVVLWFLLGCFSAAGILYSVNAHGADESGSAITGKTLTITITEEQAKACREEGGCLLVTIARDNQDTKDMEKVLKFAEKCAAKEFKDI